MLKMVRIKYKEVRMSTPEEWNELK